jgi:hypothetical protein
MIVAAGEPISPLDALRAKGMTGEELLEHAATLRKHYHHGFADVVQDEAERVLCLKALEQAAQKRPRPIPNVRLELHLEAAWEVLADLRCVKAAFGSGFESLGHLADLIESKLDNEHAKAWAESEAIND